MTCDTEEDHCVHWDDCEPCCKCGDHPPCPVDPDGNCADCGNELDGEGHPSADNAREATVRPR